MRHFVHYNARSVDEAIRLLGNGRAKLNAGGTDLLSALKGDIFSDYPQTIVNIKSIPDLDYVREDNRVLRIGALAHLSDLSGSTLLLERYGGLAEAARTVAGPQIRNVATLGGNLCQDVRCWYYRYPRGIGGPIQCTRKGSGPCPAVKGDNRYHAIMGGKKCFAVCPSDTAVALAALDGRVVITGRKGERTIAVGDFFNTMGHAVARDEMVREIEVPLRKAAGRQAFLKFALRKAIDFAVVSVASVITVEKGVCTEARIVLGAVAAAPVRVEASEKVLVGHAISEDLAREAAEAALAGARPLSKNGYKVEIAKTLVKRAILKDG